MALRFRKSINVAPGVKVNLNKKSASVTVGGKGVHRTYSSTGRKTTSVGIPGSGLYYTDSTPAKKQPSKTTRSVRMHESEPPLYNPEMHNTSQSEERRSSSLKAMKALRIFLILCGILFILFGLLLLLAVPVTGVISLILGIASFLIARRYKRPIRKTEEYDE